MYHLPDDDQHVRVLMLEELERDEAIGEVYISGRLTPQGRDGWPGLLREAVAERTPEWLADEINRRRLLATHETSHRAGKAYVKEVPHDAAQTLAEG